MEIKDGKTGSPEAKPHGSPGRKKEIREIKKPFREPAWGQPEEPGGGTKDSGIKNGVPGATPAGKPGNENGPPGRAFGSREAPFFMFPGIPTGYAPGTPFFHHLPGLPATPFGLVEGPYPESPPDVRFENHFSR